MLLSVLIIHLFYIFHLSQHSLSQLCVLFLCFMICICSQEGCVSGYYAFYGTEVFAMRHLTGEALQSNFVAFMTIKEFFFILSAVIVHYFGLCNECVCVTGYSSRSTGCRKGSESSHWNMRSSSSPQRPLQAWGSPDAGLFLRFLKMGFCLP